MDSMTTEQWIATAVVAAILIFALWGILNERKKWINRLLRVKMKQVETIRRILVDSQDGEKGIVNSTFKSVGDVGGFKPSVQVLETMLVDELLEMYSSAQKGDERQFERAKTEVLRCYSGLIRIKIAILHLQRKEIDIKREALKNRRRNG